MKHRDDAANDDTDDATVSVSEELRARLHELEETVRAIRDGEVDALLIQREGQEKVYTLHSADRRYRLMIESMQEGALTLSVDTGVVLYCNRRFAELRGAPMEQIVGHPIAAHLHPCGPLPFNALLATSGRGEFELERCDGARLPVALSSIRVEDEGSSTHCVVVTDLTERRDLEQLRLARQALLDADRRKDELLAMLGHELRNPLTPIRAALELIRGELTRAPAPHLEDYLAILDRQVTQITRLVDDLLDVARITRGAIALRREPVALDQVLAMAVESVQPLLQRLGHTLERSLPDAPLHVEGDSGRLAEVFTNLLHNAAKYTPPGGHLGLRVEADDALVTVRVRDDGVGISAALLPHVFDLFTQADATLERAQGGLGLGLTLARRLIQMHDGSIEAHSDGLGCGSEFIVRLPRRASPAPAPAPAPPDPTEAPRRPILIVDDNRDAADLLQLILGGLGHDVHVAYEGAAALEMSAALKPDVLLLDIGLPRMDGYEVARRLRAADHDPAPLLIALTGYGQAQDRARSAEAGFDHHLVKPASLDDLCALITPPDHRA